MVANIAVAIIAAAAGLACGIGLHWFTSRPDRIYNDNARSLLRRCFADGARQDWKWRSYEQLSRAVGSPDDKVARRWLIEIGARRSSDGQDLWTLEVIETFLSEADRLELLHEALSESKWSTRSLVALSKKTRVSPSATKKLLKKVGAVERRPGFWGLP